MPKLWIPAFAGMTYFASSPRRRGPKASRHVQPAVYILASQPNGTLYIGVTSDLVQRGWQHRNEVVEGFTSRYGVHMLVWYELHGDMEHAITREKQTKGGSRKRKLSLIEEFNPQWRDLFESICH